MFGEQGLSHKRVATVQAIGSVKILSIRRDLLMPILNSELDEFMYRNSERMIMQHNSEVFKQLTKKQLNSLVSRMETVSYSAGDIIIPKNTYRCEKVWVILTGTLQNEDTSEEIDKLSCIGDKDLLKEAKGKYRSNIIALTNSDVAAIRKDELEYCIGGDIRTVLEHNKLLPLLKKVQIMRFVPFSIQEQLISKIRIQNYIDGTPVFLQHDPSDAFYIIKRGKVDIYMRKVCIRTLCKNDYFGERAILDNGPRTATALAKGKTCLLVIDKSVFRPILTREIKAKLRKEMELHDAGIDFKKLKPVRTLDRARSGHVLLVVHEDTEMTYAVKSFSRAVIAQENLYDSLISEKGMLLELNYPFISKLVRTSKDLQRIYFLYELVLGGTLFDMLQKLYLLSNEQSKFYAGCIVLTLNYLHSHQIIYRGIDSENLAVDGEGYIKFTNFETAKVIDGRTYSVVGSPHYMAPEVILGQGYSLSADYWGLGILIFEFICGYVPFGDDLDQIPAVYESILHGPMKLPTHRTDFEAAEGIINTLLSRSPGKRATSKTLKKHPWFSGFNWDSLITKEVVSPVLPTQPLLSEDIAIGMASSETLLEFIEHEDIVVSKSTHQLPTKPSADWDKDF